MARKSRMWWLAGVASVFALGAQAAPRLETVLKPVRDGGTEVVAIEVRSVLTEGGEAAFALSASVTYAGVRGVADRVQDLTVTDAQGVVPLASADDPAAPGGFPYFRHWTAQRPVSYPVTISYRSAVQPAGAPQGPPFGIRPSGGGVSGAGAGFLVLPEQVGEAQLKLRWDLSGLARGSRAVASFGDGDVVLTGSPEKLRQAWYMAGPMGRYPKRGDIDGFSGTWLGQAPFDPAAELAWSGKLYQQLDKDFGYLKPAPRYRVFMRFLDTPPVGGGTALANSFMLSRGSAPRDPGAQGPRTTFAHEMIHQWVGGIESPGAVGISSWFSEGLTTHYTALAPLRAGFSTVEQYGQQIDAMARGYWGSEARDWSAEKIAKAGFGSESIRHVPYNRGALYFADLDAKIRAKSGGKRRLDDLLAPMFVSREQGAAFDHEAWKTMVGRELGPDAVATFEKVVLGGEMFTPDAGAFGPCFTREPATYEVGGAQVQGYRWVRVASVPEKVCRSW
ncbi:MAG: hypothetical protein KBC34_10480 [Phenylobacterium sp.]|nr:hypothetical protein [Phenylobacterium sp.]